MLAHYLANPVTSDTGALAALGRRALGLLVGVDLGFEAVDPLAEFLERADARFDPLRPQAEFLEVCCVVPGSSQLANNGRAYPHVCQEFHA